MVFLCEFSKFLKAKSFIVTKFRLIWNFVEEIFVKIFVRNFVTTKFSAGNVNVESMQIILENSNYVFNVYL